MNGFAGRQQSTIVAIEDRWRLAQTAYGVELKKLYRDDGSKIFSTKEHALRQGALEANLRRAADKAVEDYQAVIDAANLQLQALDVDPLLAIQNDSQRAEALFKKDFIKETCQSSTLTYLSTQLAAMVSHGSVVERLLFSRYAGERLSTLKAQTEPGWFECSNALAQLEGTEKIEDRQSAETVKRQADRQQGRVSIDLFRMGVSPQEGVPFDDKNTVAQRF